MSGSATHSFSLLVDVIAAVQHNLGGFEPPPLTLILIFMPSTLLIMTHVVLICPQAASSTKSGITDIRVRVRVIVSGNISLNTIELGGCS